MNIDTQIKEQRTKLNMTQEELASKLNVSRSTVSNWEIGRNYPDIQLIVSISRILEISLEQLLTEDSEIVQEIAQDTKQSQKQRKRIRILSIAIAILGVLLVFMLYSVLRPADISSADAISKVWIQNGELCISLDLPFYRSFCGYIIDSSPKDEKITECCISTEINLNKKQRVDELHIPLDDDLLKSAERLDLTGSDMMIYQSIDLAALRD